MPSSTESIELPSRLASRLSEQLPGAGVMRRYEPPLAFGRHFDPPPEDAREAAVMLLLYPHDHAWRLPLVVRPKSMPHHAGQVGLPGGLLEAGEEPRAAAVRELYEELGVPPQDVTPLGPLSPLWIFGSNLIVRPQLSWTARRPDFRPSEREVAELLELPLELLLDPAALVRTPRIERGLTFSAPEWHFDGHRIWGATAMMLGELAALAGG